MDIKRTIQFDQMLKDIETLQNGAIEAARQQQELSERLNRIEARKKPGPKPKEIQYGKDGHAH